MKKVLAVSFALLLVSSAAGTASALTLSSADGNWVDWTGGSRVSVSADNDTISWGRGLGRSSLTFKGAGETSFASGQLFSVGKFTHKNSLTTGADFTSADLELNLVFSDPLLEDGQSFTFRINENSIFKDIIYLPDVFASQDFTVGNMRYTLDLLGFANSIDAASSGNFLTQMCTGLGSNSTFLWAKMSEEMISEPPAAVPEPASMLLFGVGLVGLAATGRRQLRK